MGKYATVKKWVIEPSKVDDIQITLQDGDIEVRYQLPMEEAMIVVAEVKKLRRQVPLETYFQINFGGKQHGFEGNVQDIVRDLQTEINECMARRILGTQVFDKIINHTEREIKDMKLEYFPHPQTSSLDPVSVDSIPIRDVAPILRQEFSTGVNAPSEVVSLPLKEVKELYPKPVVKPKGKKKK